MNPAMLRNLGIRLVVTTVLSWHPVGAHAEETKVTIDNFTFAPAELTVKVGTTVTWSNHDDIPHVVFGPALAARRIVPGLIRERRDGFSTGTVYHGYCYRLQVSGWLRALALLSPRVGECQERAERDQTCDHGRASFQLNPLRCATMFLKSSNNRRK